MKKIYEDPEMEITKFEYEEIMNEVDRLSTPEIGNTDGEDPW